MGLNDFLFSKPHRVAHVTAYRRVCVVKERGSSSELRWYRGTFLFRPKSKFHLFFRAIFLGGKADVDKQIKKTPQRPI